MKVAGTPARPESKANGTSILPFRRLAIVPEMADPTITARLVPRAVSESIPVAMIKAGTMTIPPPTPKSPDITPAKKPTTTNSAIATLPSRSWSGVDDQINRIADKYSKPAKPSCRNLSDTFPKSFTPYSAPKIEPTNKAAAAFQST